MSLPTHVRDYVTFQRREVDGIKNVIISSEKICIYFRKKGGVTWGFLEDVIQAQVVERYKISHK